MVDALTLFTPYWFKKQYFHPNGSEPIRISMVNNSPRPIEIRTKLDVDSIGITNFLFPLAKSQIKGIGFMSCYHKKMLLSKRLLDISLLCWIVDKLGR